MAIPRLARNSDYKLRWFERLTSYAKALLDSGAPAALAGDFNVMPTDLDVYAPERWVYDALFPAGGALDRRVARVPPTGGLGSHGARGGTQTDLQSPEYVLDQWVMGIPSCARDKHHDEGASRRPTCIINGLARRVRVLCRFLGRGNPPETPPKWLNNSRESP
jgi:hypothetical protein